jgi:hypothetical protein
LDYICKAGWDRWVQVHLTCAGGASQTDQPWRRCLPSHAVACRGNCWAANRAPEACAPRV